MPNGLALTAKLVLSDNAAIEAILTQIPFFCTGILAFGLSTFFLFMKRFQLPVIFLYSSAFLSFGAAILDLSQVLARGREDIIDQNGLNGIVNTREVGLSLAIGLRLLFYWIFVAQKPRGEPLPPDRNQPHSGDWARWGYVGFFLRWALVGLVIAIPVLEMVWRIAERRYGIVYMVSVTLTVVAVALFLLKVLLNMFLSPVSPWRLLKWYAAPMMALLVNIGISVGNLIAFSFSETTLGRFFQAMELYLLMLFVLVSAFYKTPASTSLNSSSLFIGEPSPSDEKEPIKSSLAAEAQLKTPRPGFIVATPARPPFDIRASKASSWLFGRGNPRRSASQGWGRGDIEEAGMSAVSALESQDLKDSGEASQLKIPDSQPSRPVTDASLASYYQMPNQSSRLSLPTAIRMADASRNGSNSPVYGLNGIMRPTVSARSSNQSIVPSRASMSSFDELLRQQGELDKSIAALRLFSPQPPEPEPIIPSPPQAPAKTRTSRTSRSTSSWVAKGLDSASARSEFSLSIFPEPPTANNSMMPRKRLEEEFPSSPDQVMPRFASNGTQYYITSFIGDLTTDDQGGRRSTFGPVDKAEPKEASPLVGSAALVPIASPPTLGPATASSGLLTAQTVMEKSQARRLSAAPAVSSPLANPFHPRNPSTVPVGPRGQTSGRNRSGSAAKPPKVGSSKLTISGPRLQTSDGRGDQAPGAFEKPRPPPLLINQEKG